jgi:hypothetical protein
MNSKSKKIWNRSNSKASVGSRASRGSSRNGSISGSSNGNGNGYGHPFSPKQRAPPKDTDILSDDTNRKNKVQYDNFLQRNYYRP